MVRSDLLRALVASVAVLAAGCSVTISEDAKFSCATDGDCGGDGFVCTSGVCCKPSAEACNGADDDCDGAVDEDLAARSCYTGPDGTADVGACKSGEQLCVNGAWAEACVGQALPGTELCNDLDDDCDGAVDNGFDLATDAENCGSCSNACGGGQCVNGICAASSEVSCIDGADNDADTLIDCADGDCDGQSCANGGVCTNNVCFSPGETPCDDGQDNDGDTLPDCADSDCDTQSCGTGCVCANAAKTEALCNDGQDNDGDTSADCLDVDCGGALCLASPSAFSCDAQLRCSCNGNQTPGPELVCTDTADDDCDGQLDCADSDCNAQSCGTGCVCANAAKTEALCDDGQDNDGDTFPDCADPDCDTQSCGAGCVCANAAKTETLCTDSQDNDGDTFVDCADADCDAQSCGSGCVCANARKSEALCNDGQDNDGDTSADCLDVDCGGALCQTSPSAFTCDVQLLCSCNGNATPGPELVCNDAVDDDCDGQLNCADADCNAQSCGAGCICANNAKKETTCNDLLDNDGDTQTDCADFTDCPQGTACKKPNGQPGSCNNVRQCK